MDSKIIRPGQPRGISGTEAINMILQQLSQFAMEINLINMRIQTIQNQLIAKNVVTVVELEAEWNKLMEEAKTLATRAKLVTPDGQTIVPGPHGAEQPIPVDPAPAPEMAVVGTSVPPGGAALPPEAPTPGRLPANTEVTMNPEPTGPAVVK